MDSSEPKEDQTFDSKLDVEDIDHYSVGSSKKRQDQSVITSLRTKLIVPYGVLVLATAVVGLYVVSRLVSSSLRERFNNQLIEASRVAADQIVRLEQGHLENLRQMVFTEGVTEAVETRNADDLETLLFPLVVNDNLHTLSIIDGNGREIISWVYDFDQRLYEFTVGANLTTYPLVERTLAGEIDEVGDKFTGVIETGTGLYLFTSAPVRNEDNDVLGALLVGTLVDNLLIDLKQQALSDVILLNSEGDYLASTLPPPDEGVGVLALPVIQATSLEPALNREMTLYNRQYEAYYSALDLREEQVGILGIVLPTNFILSTEATSRNLLSAIFLFGAMSIVVTGFVLSQNIAKPILHLRDVSLAVSSGDLEQRTGIDRKDEIGDLANVFDEMTANLYERTIEVARLYSESVERSEELAMINARLQEAQQQLVRSEKLSAVGQLAAGIVHDVKNPLANIMGLAEELAEDLPEDDQDRPMLRMIGENASRANTIVTDLLKFARHTESNPELQDLNESIISSYRLTEYLARKNNVEVETDLYDGPLVTVYDESLIEQVFINLIQNSIQAMPEGGTLILRSGANHDWVMVNVKDEGIGIPKKNLNRIFDPFFTTKDAKEGTGLGLSVSYGIVTQHGGDIEVTSKVGEGTTFTVRLPRKIES